MYVYEGLNVHWFRYAEVLVKLRLTSRALDSTHLVEMAFIVAGYPPPISGRDNQLFPIITAPLPTSCSQRWPFGQIDGVPW